MAEPQRSIPESATNREPERPADGEAALRAALDEYGEQYADALEHTDDVAAAIRTATLVLASADDADVEYVTDSTIALANAADGLATEQTVALAEGIGEQGDDLAAAMETLAELQREGHLETFATLAAAFGDALSPEQVERLGDLGRENADDLADALDAVLDLQRSGDLDSLVGTASTLADLDLDEDAVTGMNRFFAAMGEAEREAEPTGPLGVLRAAGSPNLRAGLGYLVALLRAQGRRFRREG